jgi:hypothetical protein
MRRRSRKSTKPPMVYPPWLQAKAPRAERRAVEESRGMQCLELTQARVQRWSVPAVPVCGKSRGQSHASIAAGRRRTLRSAVRPASRITLDGVPPVCPRRSGPARNSRGGLRKPSGLDIF